MYLSKWKHRYKQQELYMQSDNVLDKSWCSSCTTENMGLLLKTNKSMKITKINVKEKKKKETCKNTPGENSEITPSLPAKSTISKILIAAGRACSRFQINNYQLEPSWNTQHIQWRKKRTKRTTAIAAINNHKQNKFPSKMTEENFLVSINWKWKG